MSWFQYSGFADEIDVRLENQITALQKFNIRNIELRSIDGKNITSHTLEEAKALKMRLNAGSVHVSAIGSPIGKIQITDPFDDHFSLFQHTLALAKLLDTRYVRIFSFLVEESDPYRYRDEVLRRMAACAKAAERAGITLLHENEGCSIYGQTSVRCLDIFESVGSAHLKATFDPGNCVYAGNDALEEYKIIAPYVEYLHIKDCIEGQKIVPVGEGKVQFQEILTLVRSKRKDPIYLSIEPHLIDFSKSYAPARSSEELEASEGFIKFALTYKNLKHIVDTIEQQKTQCIG